MRLIRTLTSGAAAAALALSTLLVLPQAAYAAEEYPVPSSGSWEVEGRGWGHGIGMSQWGAKAAAEQGLDHREILSFYYPGTEVGTVGNATIRVALQALQNQGTVAIWSPQGQTELRAGVPGQPPHVFRAGRLTVTYDRGQYQLHHQTPGGSVERVDLSGNELRVSTDDGVIVAGSPGATSATWYRGIVRLNPEGNAQMDVVNDLPLESYLRGVVPSEMPASWHTEALQAQAVAARSYVLRAGTTTCDTTQCQVYTGRARVNPTTRGVTTLEQPRSDAAIAATAGEIRTYQGGAAFTQFSSTNGGYSVAGSQPYLIAQPDPYTGTAQGDIRSRWTDRLEVSAVERHCPANGDLEQLVVVARNGDGAFGGRITEARVECDTGSTTITREFDLRFGMYSSWWRMPPPQQGFFLSNSLGGDAEIHFMYGRPSDDVLVGDWDGDGQDTVMIRRGNEYHVNNAAEGGPADYAFRYGRADDVVLVGDWDGDGQDTLAVRRGQDYHVRNDLQAGPAQVLVTYGRPADDVLVGDWDGENGDTFTIRRGNEYHVKNSMTGGPADAAVRYGRASDDVLVGDWDADSRDTFAVRRGKAYHLKNSISAGDADQVVFYGRENDIALVGDWDADGADTLGLRRLP